MFEVGEAFHVLKRKREGLDYVSWVFQGFQGWWHVMIEQDGWICVGKGDRWQVILVFVDLYMYVWFVTPKILLFPTDQVSLNSNCSLFQGLVFRDARDCLLIDLYTIIYNW